MIASAPPAATSFSLLAKAHVPRSTSTILPATEPEGRGEHARPLESTRVTSNSVPLITCPGFGPSPELNAA